MTSPYLDRPLRSEAEARRDRDRRLAMAEACKPPPLGFPKLIDNDEGLIVAMLDGYEIRAWVYRDREECGRKMLMAREFVEGWFQAVKRKEGR